MLLLVALAFFAPLLVAAVLYLRGADPATGAANHGELVLPTRTLPALALPRLDGRSYEREPLRGRWSLIVVSGDGCGERCRRALADTRRVYALLGRDSLRVDRLLLATSAVGEVAMLAGEDPELIALDASERTSQPVLDALPGTEEEGAVYLSDPLGNLVLRFAPGSDARGLHEDLKRLLRLSRIG